MGGSSGNSFGRLSKKDSRPEPKQEPGVAPKLTPEQDLQPGVAYKKGDFIGQKYKVYGVLGKGGFGIVYCVYSTEFREVVALKTFRDEFLADQEIRNRFHKEANIWIELGQHPNLVSAYFVDEISGRLFIAMPYIVPREGLNSLESYLRRRPPDLAQSLRWAIQICHGMEYAYSKGLHAHRDLKPANIMITWGKTAMITDFGLAGIVRESLAMRPAGLGAQKGSIGLTGLTRFGVGFGTPTHMAPEQFDNAAGCDERSDIYSFGIMLYQMAAGGRLPFPVPMGADFWQTLQKMHRESPLPQLDSPLFPILQHCLEKSPEKRYQTFKDVRKELEPLLQHQTGEVVILPQVLKHHVSDYSNKGISLSNLGRYEEAIHCYDKALDLASIFDSRTTICTNKGHSFASLGRYEEALLCYDRALGFDPRNVNAWFNKGNSFASLSRYEEALRCYDKALDLDPSFAGAWCNKAISEEKLGLWHEVAHSYQRFLALAPAQNADQIEYARKRLRELGSE